jgi:hypothetical protein
MGRIEKTVFLSYRRTDAAWALAIFQNLTGHGYDVFFDFTGIASGDFEGVILGNIEARAHFLVTLTPSALERCAQPDDWLRREVETAMQMKRNIVPLMLDGFDFNAPGIADQLTGPMAALKKYNGLRVPLDYFDEAMERLRAKFLNVPLKGVIHPVTPAVQRTALEQQAAANAQPVVDVKQLVPSTDTGKGSNPGMPAVLLSMDTGTPAGMLSADVVRLDWHPDALGLHIDAINCTPDAIRNFRLYLVDLRKYRKEVKNFVEVPEFHAGPFVELQLLAPSIGTVIGGDTVLFSGNPVSFEFLVMELAALRFRGRTADASIDPRRIQHGGVWRASLRTEVGGLSRTEHLMFEWHDISIPPRPYDFPEVVSPPRRPPSEKFARAQKPAFVVSIKTSPKDDRSHWSEERQRVASTAIYRSMPGIEDIEVSVTTDMVTFRVFGAATALSDARKHVSAALREKGIDTAHMRLTPGQIPKADFD